MNPTPVTLSPSVRETLARTSAEMHRAATASAKGLFALNAKAVRTGSTLYAGISPDERARRRAVGRRQRAARKANR